MRIPPHWTSERTAKVLSPGLQESLIVLHAIALTVDMKEMSFVEKTVQHGSHNTSVMSKDRDPIFW